jgi:flagellum-specific peptidoglycan hydrolase FlgJ
MQKPLYFLFIAAICFSSCSARKKTITDKQVRRNNNSIKNDNHDAIADYKPYTSLSYIDRFKDIAIYEMNQNGIPASITLAQGLFESGSGNSELARVANNHFGIKCTSEWKGKSYFKDDDSANECFRVYNNPEESFRDHSAFLKRKHYAKLFELDKNDYEGWAQGLKNAGYATNPKYPQLLINLIVKYHLDQYDRSEGDVQKIKREDRVLSQINNNIGKADTDTISQTKPDDKIYTVRQGDTLYNISKRFGITVDDLKALNSIPDNHIAIGQKLIVIK